jgi:hypothetical protein
MKSAHRHELQTNALAQRLDVAIQRLRPYASTLTWVIVGIAVAMLIWSYMSKSSATRQGDAWNAYNQVIGSAMPNLEELNKAAEEYPGTKMQELATLTWADGQVFNAAQSYIYNRRATTEALNRATSIYHGILQTSEDEWLIDRAHLGLGRVYEMKGDLGKAREEYLAVRGGYADFAKAQAERLAKPEAKETYAWLEKAVPPRIPTTLGPGTPGQLPEFDASDLSLPEATAAPVAPDAVAEPATSLEDMLKALQTLPSASGERGETDQAPPANTESPETPAVNPATEGAAPATESAPASEDAATPTSEAPSTEGDATPFTDPNTEPASPETNPTEEKSAE